MIGHSENESSFFCQILILPLLYGGPMLSTHFYFRRVQFPPGRKYYHLGAIIVAWVQTILPGRKNYYLGANIIAWAQTLPPGRKHYCLGQVCEQNVTLPQ
jgi:hypothetical protein